MIPSVMNKYIKAKILIPNSFDCIAPIYVPIRGHMGYLPAQGRLHPWDTEEARIQRQVKRINLKPVKRMQFAFDPFNPTVKSIRHSLFHFSSEKVRATNPKCIYKTDILSDRSEPTIKVLLEDNSDNLGSIVFKTANLKVEDVLTKFNEMVLPHVKVELEEDRTTKGAKKGGAASKKKKGGK